MKSTSIQQTLLSYAQRGSFTPLSAVKKILHHDGNPHEALRIYHVAGTNGKGSTCAMISQVLWKQFGKRVGLFVSPHVVCCNERVQISGVYISDEAYIAYAKIVTQKAKNVGVTLGYFALLTLIAIYFFLDEKVDCAVFEVGLGGKLDTTNLWSKPVATFITSIGFDHMHILGTTRSQIQRNKMGIMKQGVPCYTAVDNPLMHRGATVKKAPLHIVSRKQDTSLLGDHQQMNAGLVYDALVDQGYDPSAVAEGLMQVTHPGRLQFLNELVLIDGAHNEDGLRVLSEYIATIRHRYDKLITVFGTSKSGKPFDLLVPYMIEGDENYCVEPSFFREKAVRMADYRDSVSFFMEPSSLYTLLDQLLQKYTDTNTLVLVYGSLYLVSDCICYREDRKYSDVL